MLVQYVTLLQLSWVVDDAKRIVVTRASVCPQYCTYQDVTWRCGRGCPLVVHYLADLQSVHGLHCYGNITRTLVTSLRPSRDITSEWERSVGSARTAGRRPAGDGEALSKLRAVYGKWAWLAGRWLAMDGVRSQHYCGGLDCGLPMVAFWRHNANAKC